MTYVKICYNPKYDSPKLERLNVVRHDQSSENSGFDLYAFDFHSHSEGYKNEEDINIPWFCKLFKNDRVAIDCGFHLVIPQGSEAQIRPRSGLALKHGVTVLNSPGTIDAGYRGSITAIIINLGITPFVIKKGIKIAQMVFSPDMNVELEETTPLEYAKYKSQRNKKGFGSTGI